jgi:hypothetical protein
MTSSLHPPTLARRHAAIDADVKSELKRPMPDFMRVRRLKQQKLRIKDALAIADRERKLNAQG